MTTISTPSMNFRQRYHIFPWTTFPSRSRLGEKRYGNLWPIQIELSQLNSCLVQHPFGGYHVIGTVILVREIDDLLYTRLNDRLCAFIARKEGDIDGAPFQIQ